MSGCRFVPKAAVSRCGKNPLSKASLFDHFVGAVEQRSRHGEAERFRRFKIDHQLVFRRRLHWEISRALALENAIDIAA